MRWENWKSEADQYRSSAVEKRKVYFGQAVFFFCFQDENLVNPMPSNEALCTTLMPTVGSYSTRKSTEEGLSLSLSERSKDFERTKKKTNKGKKRVLLYCISAFILHEAKPRHSCFLLWKGRKTTSLRASFHLDFCRMQSLVSSLAEAFLYSYCQRRIPNQRAE